MIKRQLTKTNIFAFCLTLIVCAAIVWYFHNRSWWAYDDGFYAHVAERILNGEVLHKEVQERHAGYINFLDACSLRIFGKSLVSLRYPLAALAIFQSSLIYILFLPSGIFFSVLAALAVTAFCFIQFPNPTPNWYCLFFSVLLVFALRIKPDGQAKTFLSGFLIGTIYLFRQLTGIFMAMGVLTCLLLETHEEKPRKDYLDRWVILIMTAGMALYLFTATDWIGFILIGVWPLLVLANSFYLVSRKSSSIVRLLAVLLLGFFSASLPLIVYHAFHHSIGIWLQETLLDVLQVTKLSYLKSPSYKYILWAGGYQVATAGIHMYSLSNGIYWLILPFVNLINGVFTFFALRKERGTFQDWILPITACFYSLVSLYSQNYLYLYYSIGLALISWLWIFCKWYSKQAYGLSFIIVILSTIAIYAHAAQPLSRNFYEVFGGIRKEYVKSDSIDRIGLWVLKDELEMYEKLLAVIDRETKSTDPIFVFPNNAEVYFLSQRKNPFRFYNTALGLLSEKDVAGVIEKLNNLKPKLIIYHAGDKYETPQIQPIVEFMRRRYEPIEKISFFEIYRRR